MLCGVVLCEGRASTDDWISLFIKLITDNKSNQSSTGVLYKHQTSKTL